MHLDKHVVKMIIEYAQLMSTAHRVLDGDEYYGKTANGRRIKRWRMTDLKYENGLMLGITCSSPIECVGSPESPKLYVAKSDVELPATRIHSSLW
jgi:hypothetical protein